AGNSKQFHRIDKSRDKNFWSVRASRDIRLVVHKTGERIVLCYVDHHDPAYAWAERRVFEVHPRTQALQIVEVEEVTRREQLHPAPDLEAPSAQRAEAPATPAMSKPLADRSESDLLLYGVPPQWIERLRAADTDELLSLASHLPEEAQESVLALAVGETPPQPIVITGDADAATHPDAQRRFRVVEGREALEAALNSPWNKWTVFLHPSQQHLVVRPFNGPARVGGSAGTGKTVVALHRAKRLSELPKAKVLLTTFSRPLAASLRRKLAILSGGDMRIVPTITVASFEDAAAELYTLAHGRNPYVAKDETVRAVLAREAKGLDGFSERFIWAEWRDVVDGWNLRAAEDYFDVTRKGKRSRVGRKQRELLWPVFERTRAALAAKGIMTASMLFAEMTDHFTARTEKPYTHIVVDEAQDLGPAELTFLAAIAPRSPDALFFSGDIGQRIFQHPFSWSALGVDIRGRSSTLKVCYRTSHQIREAADRLLPKAVRDMDGLEERRFGTISLFNGPTPEVLRFATQADERATVAGWVRKQLDADIPPNEIGIFVRDRVYLPRARAVLAELGSEGETLSGVEEHLSNHIALGTMHLAKGLEYRAVAVMACDDEALPLQSRIEDAADEAELDEVYATERHLLYVACTRAREHLLVTGVRPWSEFLDGLAASSPDS
ncbi:MAG: AAA family ATPase, partial [Hyphomonadaceae bacterium]|nr:AAA family ATPase [Hyphomonadaceae bacterium]MBY0421978.1 AAA family ATPase [Parvularculaceae bacterium]